MFGISVITCAGRVLSSKLMSHDRFITSSPAVARMGLLEEQHADPCDEEDDDTTEAYGTDSEDDDGMSTCMLYMAFTYVYNSKIMVQVVRTTFGQRLGSTNPSCAVTRRVIWFTHHTGISLRIRCSRYT